MTNPFLAYISQGQLYVQGDGASQILESPFGRSLRLAIQIYNRNVWKTQGRGGQALSSAVRACPERDPGEFRIAITSVARGLNPGELLYTLETDEISGVFARSDGGVEQRLFHTADFRAIDARPDAGEFRGFHLPPEWKRECRRAEERRIGPDRGDRRRIRG